MTTPPLPPHAAIDNLPGNDGLRLAFDHAAVGLAAFDAGLQLIACNDRFLELNRLDRGRARPGIPLLQLLSDLAGAGEFGAGDPHSLARSAAAEILGESAWRRVRPDGCVLETSYRASPGGGCVLSCADISERAGSERLLSENQRALSVLFDLTEEGIWFVDNQQRTTGANPAMCRMLGRTLAQMMGSSIFDHVDETNAAVFRRHVAKRSSGRAGGYEITLLHADGQAVHCYNNATPILDTSGQKIGAVGMFSNISALKRAEQRVRHTGELLAQKSHVLEVTLDSLEQGVLSIDASGRINAWNRRFLDLLQFPESLLRARPTLQALMRHQIEQGHFGDDAASIGHATGDLQQLARGADPTAVRPAYQRTRPDGTVLEVQTFAAADASVIRTYTDVTARVRAARALADSEARFRTMADGAPALIWQSAADGSALWFNQRWRDITGASTQEELARNWVERMHPDDYARCRQAFDEATARQAAFDAEYRLRRADGSYIWIADSGIPHFSADGRFEGHIGYGWDITARKAAEDALIAARDEAERASRAKSEFLSRMSHELRTPLNAVLGFGQLLETDRDDPLTAMQRARLQELLRGGRHLLALINEVLDLARIEAGSLQLQLTAVDLAEVVGDSLRLVAPLAAERGIRLALQASARSGQVLADPVRLKQVLINLLSNAIKYNRAGGSVVMRWLADGPALRLEVEDSGPGLDVQQQERLFQAFERLGADSSGVKGAGIGLALSKWLVDLMHGEIGVRSALGVGSCFWVRLASAGSPPAAVSAGAGSANATANAKAAAGTPSAAAPRPQRTVLYIEDNPVNQILMEGMLAQRPALRLHLASLPEPGLEMARQLLPDLVLLDIQLPGIDGFEVLRRLRADPATRGIPVVAVSANAMPADLTDAERAGFDDYVTKPLDLQRLLAVVDRLLQD